MSACGSTPPATMKWLISMPSKCVGGSVVSVNSNWPSRSATSSRRAIRISSCKRSARDSLRVIPASGLTIGVVDVENAQSTTPSWNNTAPFASVLSTLSVPVFFEKAMIWRISRRFRSSIRPLSAMGVGFRLGLRCRERLRVYGSIGTVALGYLHVLELTTSRARGDREPAPCSSNRSRLR